MIHEEKKNPEHAILQQSRKLIHKPCLGSHKEHGHTNVQEQYKRKPGRYLERLLLGVVRDV